MRTREQQRTINYNRRTRGSDSSWLNAGGYLNSTEYLALRNIEREERAERRSAARRVNHPVTRVMRW